MTSQGPDFATLRFSTEDLPLAERVPFWREVFGRTIVKLDIEALPGHPFYSDAILRGLPGLGVYSAITSGMRTQRTRDLLADGNDDVILSVQMAGVTIASQLGHEVTIAKSDAVLVSSADVGVLTFPEVSRRVGLRFSRAALATLSPGLEDAFVRPIRRESEALRLLVSYLTVLEEDHVLAAPELRRLVVTHVYDLVALLIGATRDAAALAEGRGVRAARLRAIKTDIAEHLDLTDLSVAAWRHASG